MFHPEDSHQMKSASSRTIVWNAAYFNKWYYRCTMAGVDTPRQVWNMCNIVSRTIYKCIVLLLSKCNRFEVLLLFIAELCPGIKIWQWAWLLYCRYDGCKLSVSEIMVCHNFLASYVFILITFLLISSNPLPWAFQDKLCFANLNISNIYSVGIVKMLFLCQDVPKIWISFWPYPLIQEF